MRQVIGWVVGTEREPSTPHEFRFWTAASSVVGIGAIVKVVAETPRAVTVYGVVVDGASYTELQSPLHDYMGLEGAPSPALAPPKERPEIRVYTAAVLRHEPPEPLQPVPAGPVLLARDEDVAFALRTEGYAGRGGTGIPIGLYRAGGLDAPVHLDADFLLGPEAAHLNITGVSGLATKTSAVLFLLSSIFEHLPERKGRVAALCFNVKGPDLLFLDRGGELTSEDLSVYERLGVAARPFDSVHYYAPYKPDGWNLNTLRTNDALSGQVRPLVWGLEQILKFAEVLLTREDVDAKADALIEFIRERVVGRDFVDPQSGVALHRVRTFQELEAWFDDVLRVCEANDRQTWKTHHVATIRKVRNRLLNLATRAKGLVSNDDAVSDLPWGDLEDRAVYVIDIANVEPEAQDLIFARVINEARERLERDALGVKHLVVFVDELNKYAPSDAQETYVRRMLLDISERGRYLGLVLFSAQQFRSQVHKRVVGNAGTAIYGRMDIDELATAGYSVLSPAIRAKLATLPKGELMVRHPHFAHPVFLRFPRPAVMTGRLGVEEFPPAEDVPLEDAVARQVRRLDGAASVNEVKDLIAGRAPDDVLRALHRAQQVRPRDALAFFRSQLAKRVGRETISIGGEDWLEGAKHVEVREDPYS